MNRRSFIIVLFALVAVVLGAVFSFTSKPQQQMRGPIVRYAAPPPAIINVVDAPTEVVVTFVGEEPSFPDSLPVYQFANKTYSHDELIKIALSLGFTSSPTTLTYGKEIRMLWKSNESTLSFTTHGTNQSWSYGLILSKATAPPSETLLDIARAFIKKHFFSSETINLILQQEITGPIEHMQTTEIPKPSLRGFLFTNKTPNAYTVVSERFDPLLISIIVDQYGIVRKTSFVSPTVVLQGKTASIISLGEAVLSINKGLGLLVSVTQNGDSYWEKTPQFNRVSLSDVQLVYYPDQKTLLLIPFFLFHGTASVAEGSVVDVIYAVSAVE